MLDQLATVARRTLGRRVVQAAMNAGSGLVRHGPVPRQAAR
jgi:hypothetical protein